MKTFNFLNSIGHTDTVYIRCLAPKNTPELELQTRGMTWKTKDGDIKKSTIDGYIDLQSGEFFQKYGDKYKPVTDGCGYLENLNKQGYGVYFIVHHGGSKNSEIKHGTTLFHESDKLSIDEQQKVIDRISVEFGNPTAVVKTRKSLHSYWASSEIISIESLVSYQRRWVQYSNCDDASLDDPAQLMRLPGFDHVSWNGSDFERVPCELLELNDVRYSLAEFDRVLPALDVTRYCNKSLEHIQSDASDSDMRVLGQYLDSYKPNGRDGWDTAKCPSHDGESFDSLHIDRATGGFICHSGCTSSSVYNATKARAVSAGHRFEVEGDDNLSRLFEINDYDPATALPSPLRELIQSEASEWSLPTLIYVASALTAAVSLSCVKTRFICRETTAIPVLWFGLCGTSNSGKSESRNTITDPLEALQSGANEQYTLAIDEYKRELLRYEKAKKQKDGVDPGDEPSSPGCREYYVSDYTYESLAHVYQYQRDRCFLINIDELAGFFQFDKYGMGTNRDRILSLYDGHEIKVNRKSSPRIHIEKTGLSVLGTIQPTTLARLLSTDTNKEDGLWARIPFITVPSTVTYSHDRIHDNRLYTALAASYAAISNYNSNIYQASPEAKVLWTEWYNKMVDLSHAQNGGFLESIYGKAKDRAARIALALHLLRASVTGSQPADTISGDTMYHAIKIAEMVLRETEKVLAMVGCTTDPVEEKTVNFVDFFCDKGWVDAKRVRSWWSGKNKPAIAECRDFMASVVQKGLAIDNGESSESSKYKINAQKPSQSSHKSPELAHSNRFGVTKPTSQKIETINDESINDGSEMLTNPVTKKVTNSTSQNLKSNKPYIATVSGVDLENVVTKPTSLRNPDSVTVSEKSDVIDVNLGDFNKNLEFENLKSMAFNRLNELVTLRNSTQNKPVIDLNDIENIPYASDEDF